MTAGSVTPEHLGLGSLPAAAAAPAPAAAAENAFFAGNPAALGIPVFVAGSVALALTLIGYVPSSAAGAPIAIIAFATGLGLTIATIWAAAVGQSAVASVFGIFGAFWLSYAGLVLGLLHNWFAITASAAVHTQGLFLITWIVIMGMLTLATLRLPLAFTAVFALVELALIAVLIGTENASKGWLQTGGVIVFLFAAVGVYIYFAVGSAITGGPDLPLGNPIIKS
ncbi:MAG TPA: GPR1/FUN34/YaaH family transporter [Jatrophihabitantaceae bacterium]|nr:GPR1/FUN34/YaaH family transporter [Jatrophihabitantaceae bacterium]